MTLPPALDWIGWVAVVFVVVAFILAFVKMRLKKRADRLKPRPPVCRLPLFPPVHGTIAVGQHEVDTWAKRLRRIYFEAWEEFGLIYGIGDPHPLAVSRIFLTLDEVRPDHKHIMWSLPRGPITARVQDTLPFHFAGEIHNVFRCSQFGPTNIYHTISPADLAAARRVQAWISDQWGLE